MWPNRLCGILVCKCPESEVGCKMRQTCGVRRGPLELAPAVSRCSSGGSGFRSKSGSRLPHSKAPPQGGAILLRTDTSECHITLFTTALAETPSALCPDSTLSRVCHVSLHRASMTHSLFQNLLGYLLIQGRVECADNIQVCRHCGRAIPIGKGNQLQQQ